MKVILSESDIHWMVRKTINNLLLEAYQTVDSIYRKYYSDIDPNTFKDLVTLDPTYNPQMPDKLGNYAKWILNLYKKGQDVTEARDLLARYDIVKRRQGKGWEYGDINQIKSLSDLYNVIKPYSETKTNSERKSEVKQGAEKVYEDKDWIIIVPHTEEAAQLYGKGTKWCTAAINNSMFDYYNNNGPLFINIRKSDNVKFQFHFESGQFMNAEDKCISSDDKDQSPLEYNGFTEPVINFYTAQGYEFPEDIIMSHNDILLSIINRLKNGANPEDVFDLVGGFREGFAWVRKNGLGYNFINRNRQILCGDWYGCAGSFREGFAAVEKRGLGCNFINTYGQIAFKDWYDDVSGFHEGLAWVKKKGVGFNFIDTDGRLLCKDWYDWTRNFNGGFAVVEKDGLGYNFIDRKGQLLCKDWYDWADDFHEGFAEVSKGGERLEIDGNGREYR